MAQSTATFTGYVSYMAVAVILPSFTESEAASDASLAVSKSGTTMVSSGDGASKYVVETHAVTALYFYPPRDYLKWSSFLRHDPAHSDGSETSFSASLQFLFFAFVKTDIAFYGVIGCKGGSWL